MENSFFNNISGFYDGMINFNSALQRRTELLRPFIIPGMTYAADLGCGTGIDSIALNKLGLKVRAFDPSDGMIEQAQKNAEINNAKIRFYNSGINDIDEIFNTSFDIAVSLGNTIAIISEKEITSSIQKMYQILKPGGRLLLQIINFERLIKNGERIINITKDKDNDSFYIRFYDFEEHGVKFNILRFRQNNPSERTLNTTRLYPYREEKLHILLKENGFRDIIIYGGLDQKEFNIENSPDLIISAYK